MEDVNEKGYREGSEIGWGWERRGRFSLIVR